MSDKNRKNVKSADKIFRKQTLESLTPLLQLNWRRTKNKDRCKVPLVIAGRWSFETTSNHPKTGDENGKIRRTNPARIRGMG
jgi:hypothetical protein